MNQIPLYKTIASSTMKTILMLKACWLAWAATSSNAAILYQGGTVISFNATTDSLEVLRDAYVLIENDRITALGEGPPPYLPANTTQVDATGRIISPGFVDTHHHLWQTAFKTLGSNTTMPDYLQKFSEYSPANSVFTPEDVYLGQLVGSIELLHEGTTTVLDHAHGSFSDLAVDACVNGSHDSGVRTFYADAVHILPNNYTWEEQTAKLRSLATDPRFAGNDLMNLGLAYDAFYSAPAANISELWDIVKTHNLSVVTSHYMDGPWGWLNSPQRLDSFGWLNTSVPVVFSHSAFLETADARVLRARNQHISTTPESEFHFGHTHPHIEYVLDQGSVGVDCHFTYSSSMVQQARLWLQSLRYQAYFEVTNTWKIPPNSPMSVQQAFHLITRAGGLALRRQDLGVIRVGAKADIVTFRGDSPNMLGWYDPVAAVILHSDVGDIEDVIVNGRYVKRNGRLLFPGWNDVKSRFAKSVKRIQTAWSKMEWPAITGDFNEGAAQYGMARQIDTQRGPGTGY